MELSVFFLVPSLPLPSFLLKIFLHLLMSEDNLPGVGGLLGVELALSFHPLVLGSRHRSSGLAAGSFTNDHRPWQSPLPLSYPNLRQSPGLCLPRTGMTGLCHVRTMPSWFQFSREPGHSLCLGWRGSGATTRSSGYFKGPGLTGTKCH